MIIFIIVLTGILFVSQFALCVHQLKKRLPDGKLLLAITIVSFVIWVPLSVCRLATDILWLHMAWFVVSAVYMIFTIWYTKKSGRPPKKS